MRNKEEVQAELIEVLYSQVIDLTLMSKIELGDDVIEKIKHLKEELKGIDNVDRLRQEHVLEFTPQPKKEYSTPITKEDVMRVLEGPRTTLGLINYEGNCLTAEHGQKGLIAVYDQWDELCELLDQKDFLNFIDGKYPIYDSRGKEWVFTEHHREAKPTSSQIYNFLNEVQTGDY